MGGLLAMTSAAMPPSTAATMALRTSVSTEATSSSLPRCTNSSSRIMLSSTVFFCALVRALTSTAP